MAREALKTVVLLLAAAHAAWGIDLYVKIREGLVRGIQSSDGTYLMFLGLRYAKVDRNNVFGDAKPIKPYDGIFEANMESPQCPQKFGSEIDGDLDCLSVNIFVPNAATRSNLLPVMIWIHGGGFESGSNSIEMYNPEFLIKHNVIVVTINYRLGIYGFMCPGLQRVPGNTGLKDQQLALRWIYTNIVAFGGNDRKITIFGQSAGAASCHFHILNRVSSKYFSQAILQSGNIFTDGVIEEPNIRAPIKIAKELGYHANTPIDAVNFLNSATFPDLINASKILNINFKPCIEVRFGETKGFLTRSPKKIIETGAYKGIPIIIGHTSSEEGGVKTIYKAIKKRFYLMEKELKIATNQMTHFYYGDDEKEELINFDSDITHNFPAFKSLSYHTTQSNKLVYQYVFDYSGNANKNESNNVIEGVRHGEDLKYFFKSPRYQYTEEDNVVINRLSTMWTNFARVGNPTPSVTSLLPINWMDYLTQDKLSLWIDSELTVRSQVFNKRMAFWDLFFTYFEPYYWLS